MEDSGSFNWAIVGMGFIAPRHISNIKAVGGNVVLTCDIDPEKKADFTDWMEMFHHPRFKEVDWVAVCVPNYLHSVISREALRLGKQVLCEKPLSINGWKGLKGVKTVMQLRYHPELQNVVFEPNVKIVAKMFRDDKYWNGWKGNDVKSGGILYNLGVHYIDLLIYLLGNSYEIIHSKILIKSATGLIKFKYGLAEFHIEILDNREGQERYIQLGDKRINLSNQDNLSYEDLHKRVYEEIKAGRGIDLKEAVKSLELIEKLKAWHSFNA